MSHSPGYCAGCHRSIAASSFLCIDCEADAERSPRRGPPTQQEIEAELQRRETWNDEDEDACDAERGTTA